MFNKNDTLKLSNGKIAIIKKHIGSGAQGDVYLVSVEKKDYALKVYKHKPKDSFIENLDKNIKKRNPSPHFIWPLSLIDSSENHVGYIMNLIPKSYTSFIDLLNGKICFSSLDKMITWAIHVVSAFQELHMTGYSYQDINDGSFFLNPDTGDALICDNDNISEDQSNHGILGKMKFMAPEVILGKQTPDVYSDRHSLAVILFMLLNQGHPFLGEHMKKFPLIDEKAEYVLFGSHPTYIFNEIITTNRPIHGYHGILIKRWHHIPKYIKACFEQTFVDGIQKKGLRTTENEWIKALFRYRDELATCPYCHFQFLGISQKGDQINHCPNCKKQTPYRFVLRFKHYNILMDAHKKLYEPHIDNYSPNFNKTEGEIITNKLDHKLLGLKNIGNKCWEIKDTKGKTKKISHEQTVPVIKGISIQFDANTYASI